MDRKQLSDQFTTVRTFSETLCQPLKTEDYVIQTVTEVSPPKWHLAHTTWTFEHHVLERAHTDYQAFHEKYDALFNDNNPEYGQPHPRAYRGLLSRPTVEEVYRYREYVNQAVFDLIDNCTTAVWREIAPIIELALHHEQQHQEVLLADIKHIFYFNPLRPAFLERSQKILQGKFGSSRKLDWIKLSEEDTYVGHKGKGFAFENEYPRHRVVSGAYSMGNRLTTNGEYLEFVESGAYRNSKFWLADGWYLVQRDMWEAPLYWEKPDGKWWNMTLSGMVPLNENEPVCHVSYYEADAFANWKGKRLPSEFEWERVAESVKVEGNFVESEALQPQPCQENGNNEVHQLYGDVWEWTASPFIPYPNFQVTNLQLGENHSRNMVNQFVLRGGSCASSRGHLRPSYRNHLYPQDRWQFSGIRLAD